MAKIFMAEDDPLMIRMYERAFRASGFELDLAFDGDEALVKLERMDPPPTVILLDVMMPKKNGFDVLVAVKKNEKLKNVPVIMLTNLAGEADAKKATDLGAVLYLVKSEYDPRQILEKIKEVLAATDRGGNVPRVAV